ncbi:MAG: ROK family protein [Candidatus Obscuribacterales bacterium]|nr:ROK family protein [Candidatus Obscuribacterales bacterium]
MANSASFKHMRQRNIDAVVNCVRDNPGISRAEVAKETCLAKATISEIVEDLLKKNILQELGAKASNGGRPAVGLAFNPSYGYVLGISLEETSVGICLLDLDGNVCSEVRSRIELDWTAEQVSHIVMDSLQAKFAERACSLSDILALGLAIPGHVELSKEGRASTISDKYNQFIHILRKYFDCPMSVDSNMNASAMSEIEKSQTQQSDLVLIIRLGHIVRLALVVDGKILTGGGASTGELGHINLPYNEALCSCGMVGCINTVAGTGAMLERGQRAGIDISNFDELITHCILGDNDAQQIVKAAGEAVGYGLSIAINLIAPNVVIVSGPAIAAKELILGPLCGSAKKTSLANNFKRCRIIAGRAGDKAESYGAALLAIKKLVDMPIRIKAQQKQE